MGITDGICPELLCKSIKGWFYEQGTHKRFLCYLASCIQHLKWSLFTNPLGPGFYAIIHFNVGFTTGDCCFLKNKCPAHCVTG